MIRKKRRGCAIVPVRGRDLNLVIAPSLGASNRLFRCANRPPGAGWEHAAASCGKISHLPGSNLLRARCTYPKRCPMTQADHYRDQSIRARRLARAVADPEASRKLAEMAEEFRLYAERLEESSRWKSAAAS
jgi:hypothetical protein